LNPEEGVIPKLLLLVSTGTGLAPAAEEKLICFGA